jgi:hypothetical protein
MLETLKRIVDKRLHGEGTPTHDEGDVDAALPAHIRIGAPVQISAARFATLVDALVIGPAQSLSTILAVSSLRLLDVDGGPSIFRLYVKRDGGDVQDRGATAFVQVLVEGDQVQEATYFESLTRFFPTTSDEMDAFLGKGFGLGESTFTLSKEQLQGAQVALTLLDRIQFDDDCLRYEREIPGADYICPLRAKDIRIDEPSGVRGQESTLNFMGYARKLSGGQIERLIVQFTEVNTVDGQVANDVHVDCFVGITLPQSSFKVIG